MTEPKLDEMTLEVVIEVILNDIDIPPQGRLLSIKAIHRMFPEQTPPWSELQWRIKRAEEDREKRQQKRRAKEKDLMRKAQLVLGKE